MPPKPYKPEDVIRILREMEVLMGQGLSINKACKQLGITAHTFYRWRKEYGGIKLEHLKRLKELEKENSQLKRLVADLSLDIQVLKEVTRGNF